MANILLIDDDTQLLQLMDTAFRKNGYCVTTAVDGKKAIAILREQAFDVVITDIIMPEADGVEVLTAIAMMSSRPAVIAVSGGSQRVDADFTLTLAKSLKADLVIQKPVTPGQLLEAVEMLLLIRKNS